MLRMAEFVEWQILAGLPHAQEINVAKGGAAAGDTEGAHIYRFEGPLFFGVATTIFDALERIDLPPSAYVIDFRMVPFIDRSAVESFFAFAERAHREGRRVIVAGARQNVRRKLIANQPSTSSSSRRRKSPQAVDLREIGRMVHNGAFHPSNPCLRNNS